MRIIWIFVTCGVFDQACRMLDIAEGFLVHSVSIPTLKSPKMKSFSYDVECTSRFVLNTSRLLQIIVLFVLYEQLTNHFSLGRISST